MKRIVLVALIGSMVLSGCGSIYRINSDGSETLVVEGDDLVTVEVLDNEGWYEEVTQDLEDSTSEENSNDDESVNVTDSMESNNFTSEDLSSNDSNTDSEHSESDTSESESNSNEAVENDIDHEMIELLFVTQFSNEKPFNLDVNVFDLDTSQANWSFRPNDTHEQITAYNTIDIEPYDAYFLNHKAIDEKVVYLTFDEGYEQGYTPAILDTLKENSVRASFFITGDYIDREPDLVKRMADEGHIVGNHTLKHPDLTTIDEERIYHEITGLNDKYVDLTGKDMDPFFRPPGGSYSEKTLYLTRKLGYRTIFWSMAYKDWLVDAQPGQEKAHEHVMTNYHNGCIILLHAVSESNTLALDKIIKDLKAEGYRFGSLYELE